MGLFISFEGGDGTGKTTQTEMLRTWLTALGYSNILVHEPGSTPLGERLRSLIKGELPMSYGAELFLFSAARAELVTGVIKPALDRAEIVVTDRFTDSTVAYQGYGRGLDLDQIRVVNALSTQGLVPDLTILLDMPPEEALGRRTSLQRSMDLEVLSETAPEGTSGRQRRFEEEAIEFHRRVRTGYLMMARGEPERWLVVDAAQTVEVVSDAIRAKVESVLSRMGPKAPQKSGSPS